jgi:hypothetical protein
MTVRRRHLCGAVRTVTCAAVVVAAVTASAVPGSAATPTCPTGLTPSAHDSPVGGTAFTVCSGRLPSFDGTPIDVDVSVPDAAGGPRPLVVMQSGWATAKTDYDSTSLDGNSTYSWHWNNAWFVSQGDVVLTFTPRGFFKSCGNDPSGYTFATDPACAGRASWTHLADRRWEIHDAQYLAGLLVDAGLARPAQIVATGSSYGGGESWLLALSADQVMQPDGTLVPWTSPHGTPLHLAAAVPQFGWTDLAQGLLDNGTTVERPVGVLKSSYLNFLYAAGRTAGQLGGPGDPSADLQDWVAAWNQGEPYDSNPTVARSIQELQAFRSAYFMPVPTTHQTPVFAVQGITDPLFPASQATRMLDRIQATQPTYPVYAFFGDLGHQYANNPHALWAQANDAANVWLAAILAGRQPSAAPITWTTAACGASPTISTMSAGRWGSLATGTWKFTTTTPMATSNTSGEGPEASALDPVANTGCRTLPLGSDPGVAAWTFAPPATGTLVGPPSVHLTLSMTGADAEVAVRLFDVDPAAGNQTLITRGIERLTTAAGPVTSTTVNLWPTGWVLAAGHALKLEITQQDGPTWRPDNDASALSITGVDLTVPVR